MKESPPSQLSSFEVTWSKLESIMNISTTRTLPLKPSRPATGRIRTTKNLSMDFPSTKPESRRTSRLNLSTSSFIKEKSSKNLSSRHSKSFSYNQIPSILSNAQIKKIYEAKCLDLEIAPFPEQEKRFFSYCFKHFYDRNFELNESGLGLQSARVISEILQNTDKFSYIKLSKNTLGDSGFVELMKGIYKNFSICHLDCSSNEITHNGLKDALEFFLRNESIASLDISSHKGLHRNRFCSKGAEIIGKIIENNKILSILNISGTAIGPDGLKFVIKGLETATALIDLNLAGNSLGPEKIYDLAKSILKINLIKLDLSNNKISNEGAESISEMLMGINGFSCSLEHLDISSNEINTKGLSKIFFALTNNQTLCNLNLSNNLFAAGLSNNFAAFIIENSGIKVLNLSGCEIKSIALACLPEALPKNRSLENVDLSSNKIDDCGAESICIGLSRNLSVKRLNLSFNFIKEKGGKCFANCFKINHSLEELNLRENNINDQAGQELEDICRKNRNLLELNLDLNPLALRFVYNIKDSLKKNKLQKEKKIVPELRLKINHLNQNSLTLANVNKNIKSKQSEINELNKRIEKNNEKFKSAVEEEQKKNELVSNEFEEIKNKSIEVSKELESILTEATKLKAREERYISKISEEIGGVVAVTKSHEKNRKFYKGMRLKEEIALKKKKVGLNFSGILDNFKNIEITKKLAEENLSNLKQLLIEKKRTIENLKFKKSKKIEEGKTYLATEKLAKKIGGDRSSKNSSMTPRNSIKK